MSNGEATVNVVRMSNGKREASIRVTKHEDGRITSDLAMSIAWRPIGGLKAAFSRQVKLEAKGYKVISAT
jgi:hypothetical protein